MRVQAAPTPLAHVVAENLFESSESAGQGLGQSLGPSLAGRQQRSIAALNGESRFEIDKTPVSIAASLCEQGHGVVAEQVLRYVVAEQVAGLRIDRRLNLIAVHPAVPLAQQVEGLGAVGVGWLNGEQGPRKDLGRQRDAFGVDAAHSLGRGRALC